MPDKRLQCRSCFKYFKPENITKMNIATVQRGGKRYKITVQVCKKCKPKVK